MSTPIGIRERVDVLVVGAGQAGLAAAYHLEGSPCSFLVFDSHRSAGGAWLDRCDSLVLFSPRVYSSLPGLALPGDPAGYPTGREVAEYLQNYVREFQLPVITGEGIARLERHGDVFLARTTAGGAIEARAVIVATGPFQRPVVPAFAAAVGSEVGQLTAVTYRRPAQVSAGPVLVVGDGATGRQIARELAPTHAVWLSTGRSRRVIPQRLLGRDTMWWSDRAGLLSADRDSFIGRRVRAHDVIPGMQLRLRALRRAGVRVVPRTVAAAGRRFTFEDGTGEDFDTVIWALGYSDDFSWIAIPEALDEHGRLLEERGVSPVPGLCAVGRSWQNSRGSALLCGVGDDAGTIVTRVVRRLLRLSGRRQALTTRPRSAAR